MKKIVLTTCSANHLAQAKNLCDSVLLRNPAYQCVIGLVDRIDGRFEKERFHPHTLIEAHELGLPDFPDMAQRYNVFELNCAMKSFFVRNLLEQHKPDLVIYLDSDILVFDSLQVIEYALSNHSYLVNPHCTRLYPNDGLLPSDRNLLRTGIYNAGFFALKNDPAATSIIEWLNQKMIHQCYDDPADGLFVDQKWYNLIPAFFRDVATFTNPGCNLAYWNFHEREVKKVGDTFLVNDEPLVFFHFSGYSMDQPDKISKHQTRYTQVSEDVKALLQIYHQALEQSGHEEMLAWTNAYVQKKKSLGKKIKSIFKLK